jgi:hypothetical protein
MVSVVQPDTLLSCIHIPMKKTASTLRPLKDNLGLKNSRHVLYTVWVQEGICWTHTQQYRDQMQGAHKALLPGPTRKIICSGTYHTHRAGMKFSSIHRLTRVNGYIDSMVKEAIEIQLHLNSFNRGNGFVLSKMWQPLLHHLHTTAKHNDGQTAISRLHSLTPIIGLHRWASLRCGNIGSGSLVHSQI